MEFKSGLYQTQKKISEDARATVKETVLGAMSGINNLVKNQVGAEINAGCKMIRDAVKSEAQECFSAYILITNWFTDFVSLKRELPYVYALTLPQTNS